MNKFCEIWLGDVMRTFDLLAPKDDQTRQRILKLLGFTLSQKVKKKEESDSKILLPQKDNKSFQPEIDLITKQEEERPISSQVPVKQSELIGDKERSRRLQPIDYEPLKKTPAWLRVTPLEPPGERNKIRHLPYEPLFRKNWIQDLITASLSTDALNGPINISLLVEKVARGQRIEYMPRFPWPSLHKGVQILIDLSEGMEPFIRDEDELVSEIRQIIGKDLVTELKFRGCPLRGAGSGPVWTWKAYVPPPIQTPVLVLTDLGIGGPLINLDRANEKEWLSFVHCLAKCFCPAVFFVPYPPERWPKRLMEEMHILQWDRTTTVGIVRRLIGRSLKVDSDE